MQRAAFLQGIAGAQPSVSKRCTELKVRVQKAVDIILSNEILVYLRELRNFHILDNIGLQWRIVGLLLTSFMFHICCKGLSLCVNVVLHVFTF